MGKMRETIKCTRIKTRIMKMMSRNIKMNSSMTKNSTMKMSSSMTMSSTSSNTTTNCSSPTNITSSKQTKNKTLTSMNKRHNSPVMTTMRTITGSSSLKETRTGKCSKIKRVKEVRVKSQNN